MLSSRNRGKEEKKVFIPPVPHQARRETAKKDCEKERKKGGGGGLWEEPSFVSNSPL